MEDNKVTSQNAEVKPNEGVAEKSLVDLLKENPRLQSEFDKLNAKSNETAISNAKSKWEEELATAKSEAEKLAKMDADEKNKYELEKERKAKEEAISKLNAYELKETALKIAKEKELDVSLLDVIDFSKETAETIKTKIETIDSVYKKAVEVGIKNGFKEETPKTVVKSGNSNSSYLDNKYKNNPYYGK